MIVGLGNIGETYRLTRHNIGFLAVDAFAEKYQAAFEGVRFGKMAEVRLKNQRIFLLKPDTFMNLSGKAVAFWLKEARLSEEDILIVLDDIHLGFGTLRLRANGSPGGHNGLKSISDDLKTNNYARLRFGIGGDFPKGAQADYVLSQWSAEEMSRLPQLAQKAVQCMETFALEGVSSAMGAFNRAHLSS